MQNLNMPLEQAFDIIGKALASVNANRETHAVLQTAEQRVKYEIVSLQGQLEAANIHIDILNTQIKELQHSE